MAASHNKRQVRIFALYRDDVRGEHFGIVRSGTWADILPKLSVDAKYVGARNLFIERENGKLVPLMA